MSFVAEVPGVGPVDFGDEQTALSFFQNPSNAQRLQKNDFSDLSGPLASPESSAAGAPQKQPASPQGGLMGVKNTALSGNNGGGPLTGVIDAALQRPNTGLEDLKGFVQSAIAGTSRLPGSKKLAGMFEAPGLALIKAGQKRELTGETPSFVDTLKMTAPPFLSPFLLPDEYQDAQNKFEAKREEWGAKNPLVDTAFSLIPTLYSFARGGKGIDKLLGSVAPFLAKAGPEAAEAIKQLPKLKQIFPRALEGIKAMNQTGLLTTAMGALEDQTSPEELAKNYGLGAVGEGASKGLGALLSGIGNLSQKSGVRLLESLLKRPKKVLSSEASKGLSLEEEMFKRGTIGTQSSILKSAQSKIDSLENQLQQSLKALDERGVQVSPEKAISKLKGLIDDLDVPTGTEQTSIDKVREAITKLSGEGNLSVSQANQAKRKFYKLFKDTDWAKGTDELGAIKKKINRLSSEAYRESIDDVFSKVPDLPQASKINKDLSFNIRLRDAIEEAQSQGKRKPILGLTQLGLTGGGAVTGNLPEALLASAALGIGQTALGKTGLARLLRMISRGAKGEGATSKYTVPALLNSLKVSPYLAENQLD